MRIYWLATTAVALVIGTAPALAQPQPGQPQKQEGHRAQSPAAGEHRATERPDRAAQSEKGGAADHKDRAEKPDAKSSAAEQPRGQSGAAERKQAQEAGRDTKQKQGEAQPGNDSQSGKAAQQNQDQQKGAKQASEPKQRQGRGERKQDNAQKKDSAQKPNSTQKQENAQKQSDTKQQQSPHQSGTDPNNNKAAQKSSTPSPQQNAGSSGTSTIQQGSQTGQAAQSTKSGTSTTVNDPQRTQIGERLRSQRTTSRENINVRVSVGERLPPRVHARPLPSDIVRIAPQYRGYEYTVVQDEIYIVKPRTREVVDVIREPGPSSVQTTETFERSSPVKLTTEQRETFKRVARPMNTAPVASSGSSGPSCMTLQPVPEELTRSNPELANYRMLAIGDQIVLIDPKDQKIVDVIQ